jgi:YihY family inner membrane protein
MATLSGTPADERRVDDSAAIDAVPRHQRRVGFARGYQALLASWPVRGFREAGAGHLAAILAFNGLVALVPTFLLLVSIGGLLLQRDSVLTTAIYSAYWALPSDEARQALEATLTAKQRSGWFALAGLVSFLWIGSGFFGALNHCLNRIYGEPDCGFVCTRRRGALMMLGFAILFAAATLATTLPTFFVRSDLNPYFATWRLAKTQAQVLTYGLGFVAAALLFLFIYRFGPTAGQTLPAVWPGALVAATLFVVLGQAFPLYVRLIGGVNRFGAAFGLLTLLLAWFAALAHVTLFGCYVNASLWRAKATR